LGLLHLAASTEAHHDVIQLLIDVVPNIDVNLRGPLGETPLQVAALKGLPLNIRTLMDCPKINAAAVDAFGATALWYASVNGHLEVVEELLRGARGGKDVGFALKTNSSSAMPNSSALDMARTLAVRELLDEYVQTLELQRGSHPIQVMEAASGYWTPPKSASFSRSPSTSSELSGPPVAAAWASSVGGYKIGSDEDDDDEDDTRHHRADRPSEREITVECDFQVFHMCLSFPYETIEELMDELAVQLRVPAVTTVQYQNPRTGQFEDLESVALLNSQTLITTLRVPSSSTQWWSWEVAPLSESTWVTRQEEHRRSYHTMLVKEGPSIRDAAAFEKLSLLLEGSSIELEHVKRAVAVSNLELLAEFEAFREQLWAGRKAHAPKSGDGWQQKKDAPVRQRYLDQLSKFAERFPWNTGGDQPTAIPMFFPTLESRLHQICQGGFAETEVNFTGPYGRGRYLTSTLRPEDTSLRVAKLCHPGCNLQEGEVLLVVLVSPGKAFPVTEHPLGSGSLKGKPCVQGFTSHYSLANRLDAIPITGGFNPQRDEDHLVIFHPAQVLPLFYLTF